MGKLLIIKNADFSDVAVAKVTPISGNGPTITISSEGVVTLTDAYAKNIYYTINGDSPTTESTKYSGEFTVRSGVTVIAMSEFTDGSLSNESSKMYDSGVVDTSYSLLAEVAEKTNYFSDGSSSANMYYITDGTTIYANGKWTGWNNTGKITIDPNATKITNCRIIYYYKSKFYSDGRPLHILPYVFLDKDGNYVDFTIPTLSETFISSETMYEYVHTSDINIPSDAKYVVISCYTVSSHKQQAYWG